MLAPLWGATFQPDANQAPLDTLRDLVATCQSPDADSACVGAPQGIRFGEPSTLCTTFYECNGQAGNCTIRCPFGYAFNFKLQTCGYAHDQLSLATCNNHLASTSTTATPLLPLKLLGVSSLRRATSPPPSDASAVSNTSPPSPDDAGDFWQTLIYNFRHTPPCNYWSSACCGHLYVKYAQPFGEVPVLEC